MVIRKCVTDAIDGGKMAEKLSKIPCIHVAGTKVLNFKISQNCRNS